MTPEPLFPSMSNAERYAKVLKHLNPLFKRSVREKGSPFAKSISNQQASILMRDLEMPEIMEATLDNVMESINIAVDAGVAWAPWHLTGVLQKQRLAAYKASRAGNRGTRVHPLVKGVANKLWTEEKKDQQTAEDMIKLASPAEQRAMVKWAVAHTDRETIGTTAAYLTKIKHDRQEQSNGKAELQS